MHGDGAKSKQGARRPSNLGCYLGGDISADNLVKIESSPEASSQRKKFDVVHASVKSRQSQSKAADGLAGDGATPPSIRVSRVDLAHGHSSSRQDKREAASSGEEPHGAGSYGPKAQQTPQLAIQDRRVAADRTPEDVNLPVWPQEGRRDLPRRELSKNTSGHIKHV